MIYNKTGSSSRVSFKTKLFTIVAAVTLSGAAAALPFATMADATTNALMAQIAALQAQLASLTGTSTMMSAHACTFTRALTVGAKGDDVTCLQTYLESTGYFTYTGAKGYFGSITKKAVASWQAANGVSPAAGYFGAISRAKYTMLITVLPTPTWTPTTTPTPTVTGATPTPTPIPGSGLTVMPSSNQPSDGTLAPPNAARIPALGVVFTAANDGDVTVKSITIQRVGQAADATVDSIVLLDDNKTQIGLSKTLNSLHQVKLDQSFTVPKGTSKTMWIAFNRPVAGAHGGEIVKLEVVSVDAGTSTVTGTMPIIGPGFTINETLTIGALSSPVRGVLDPGSARTSLQVGSTAFYASGARWTVGSAEAVSLEQVRFYQAGSAGAGDLANVMITVKGVDYPTTVSADGKYYTAVMNPGIVFDKGANIDIAIKTDVAGGSNRTIDFDIQKRTDIVAKGTTFGYYILPDNGTTANTTTQGEGFTSTEPYYDAYLHTISAGTLRLEKSNNVASGNVPLGTSNTVLGSFGFDTKGEATQISSLKLTYTVSAGLFSYITGVSIVDDTGATVAGPADAIAGFTTTFTDTFTAPVGYHVYTIKGKLSSSFSDGTTFSVAVTPSTDITAKGQVTGLTLSPTPSSAVSANTMTIRKAGLKVSVSDSPVAQNVVRGINGFLFSNIQYDATASGEDLRITSQDLTIVVSGSADPDNLNSCQMFDGTTALNTGSNVVSPSGNPAGTNLKATFTMDNNLIVPKGTVKLVAVKCNIDSQATSGQTWSLGLTAATGNDTVVVGKDTGTTVTETTTNANGSTMTIQTGGSFTVAIDPSSPSERYGIAGMTDVGGSVFQITSQFEAIKLTKFGFDLASSTASTSDILKVSFWDGVTKVGEAVFSAGNYYGTSTFSSDFIIPKDSQKKLSTTVDLIAKESIGKAATIGGDSGHLAVINWSGGYPTATEGIGQSSGTTLNTATTSDTAAKGIRIVKTYPTLARLGIPTNTLTNGDMDLYRFSVTAPTQGDVGLYKFTFRVGTGTMATSTSFRIFGYTDSGFSNAAYATNPLNQNDVDCIGNSSLKTSANSTCKISSEWSALSVTGPDWKASSTQVALYFDPQSGTATVPGREAIQVPAGQTRYFSLKANEANVTVGDSFSVALVGDPAFAPTLTDIGGTASPGIAADTLRSADMMILGSGPLGLGTTSPSSNFVWSPDTTTTSATTTNDWLNGYLLPGLPSTEMSQQSFSK